MKFRTVSTGSLICWPLVAAWTPPPRPPPAAAPMAAPLPPPARAPIIAPMPAPAPTFFCGIFAARTSLFFELVGGEVIGTTTGSNTIQLQNQDRLSGKFACALQIHNMALNPAACRNGDLTVRGDRGS